MMDFVAAQEGDQVAFEHPLHGVVVATVERVRHSTAWPYTSLDVVAERNGEPYHYGVGTIGTAVVRTVALPE